MTISLFFLIIRFNLIRVETYLWGIFYRHLIRVQTHTDPNEIRPSQSSWLGTPRYISLTSVRFRIEKEHLRRRDVNLGMGTRYPPGTRPDRYGYGDNFFTHEWHPYPTRTEMGM
jgi:hypothetical protein